MSDGWGYYNRHLAKLKMQEVSEKLDEARTALQVAHALYKEGHRVSEAGHADVAAETCRAMHRDLSEPLEIATDLGAF